jgi:hypothetical protein
VEGASGKEQFEETSGKEQDDGISGRNKWKGENRVKINSS